LIAQCPDNASAGNPINPVPNGTTICNDGSNQEILANDVSTIGYSGINDYAFFVTAPPNENGIEEVLDVTFDGIYDFSMDSIGVPYLPGQYCFTGFGFNQAQLDEITNNNIIQALFDDCLQGGETLDLFLTCVQENPIDTGDAPIEVITVDDFVNTWTMFFENPFGVETQACVAVAEPYCVTVEDASICGEVVPPDCNAIAGTPTNPVPDSMVICSDGSNMDLLLQDLSSIEYSGIDNYAFFVTAPPDSIGDENIIGTTYDGVFNFAESPYGKAFPSGEYCFVGVGYNQSELDVKTATQLAQTGNNSFVVDVSALATGIYAYKLESEGSAFTRRLIVY